MPMNKASAHLQRSHLQNMFLFHFPCHQGLMVYIAGPWYEVLEMEYNPALSHGWILGSCCLKGVSGSRSVPGMYTFGIQR